MKELIKDAIDENSSDIHITEGKRAFIRTRGNLVPIMGENINLSHIDEFIKQYIPDVFDKYKMLRQRESLRKVDGAFEFMGRRFRVNIYLSTSGVNLAIRLLSSKIPSLDKLCLPESIKKFTDMESGLVLVTGSTGSGKSTTLASIIDAINHKRCENIITVEEPIEYVYEPDLCRIEQIEVGLHIDSFQEASIAAMRQNPNILLIGEMRDLTTIQNAITLAETGHLVFGTLHTKSVCETVDRIIGVFQPEQQEQIRIEVSSILRGIVHQTLIKTINNGLAPLIEMVMVDDVVSSMIRQRQKSNTLRDYLRGKTALGNVHIADNAAWHSNAGRINLDTLKNILSIDDYNMAKSMIGSSTGRRGF